MYLYFNKQMNESYAVKILNERLYDEPEVLNEEYCLSLVQSNKACVKLRATIINSYGRFVGFSF